MRLRWAKRLAMPMFDAALDFGGDMVFWAGMILIVLATLVAIVLILQWGLSSSDRRLSSFRARWLPVIFQSMFEELDETSLPHLPKVQQWKFLLLWVHALMAVRGDSAHRLSRLGRAMNLQPVAHKALRRRHPADRMMATLALGFLRETQSIAPLLRRLSRSRGQEQIYVCRALLEMDAKANAATVLMALTRNPGFDSAAVASLLKPFAKDLWVPVKQFLEAVWQGGGDQSMALTCLRLADALHLSLPSHLLLPALRPSETQAVQPEVVSAALRLYTGDGGSQLLSQLAAHPEWPVRVQVARALGHLGSSESVPVILNLLKDRQWWVRYRAAQALLSVPGLTVDEALQAVIQGGDRYAQSMLLAVMAERSGGRSWSMQ